MEKNTWILWGFFCFTSLAYSPEIFSEDELDRLVPRAPRVPVSIQISKECANLVMHFEWKKFALAERLVGFWENKKLGLSDREFNKLIVRERELVSEKRKQLPHYAARELLRGAASSITGWGNCGEHTALLWTDLYTKAQGDEIMGCKGAKIFDVIVSVGGKKRDHVWIEVWVPKDESHSIVRRNSYEEPTFISEKLNGQAGYYLVFDAGSDETGPYRVVRKILMETEKRIPHPSEYVAERTLLDPASVNAELFAQTQKLAFEVGAAMSTREQVFKSGFSLTDGGDDSAPFRRASSSGRFD